VPGSAGFTRFDRYLRLADDLSATAGGLAEAASEILSQQGRVLTFRNRTLVGLALKIDSAFAALIEDSRAFRSEAMHHLKTMAEAFVYFRFVVSDASDRTAEFLVAEAHDLKAEMLEEGGQVSPDEVGRVRRSRDELLRGEKMPRRRSLKRLAKDHGLGPWYWRVYKVACQPAHLGDLVDFMPEPRGLLEVGGSGEPAIQTATEAIHFGISLMLEMFDQINRLNELGLLRVPLDEFRQRFTAIASGD
jgi:hypothetical protein